MSTPIGPKPAFCPGTYFSGKLNLMTRSQIVAGFLFISVGAIAQIPTEKWIRVTNDKADDFHPSFSPDGKYILFDSEREGHTEVYTANADGTSLRRLTPGTWASDHPQWFPDGKILFESNREGAKDIYTMMADGTNVKRLTINPGFEGGGVVSPDGKKIAYAALQPGNVWNIFTMDSTGENIIRIVDDRKDSFGHTWAPDGQHLLFTWALEGNTDIFIADSNGKFSRLTTSKSTDQIACWPRNTDRIIFQSDRDGNFELYSMKTDGSDVRRLTNAVLPDGEVAISSDGRRVAFIRGEENEADLFIMNIDGTHETQLTKNAARESVPAWSPDGKKITFVSNVTGDLEVFVIDIGK